MRMITGSAGHAGGAWRSIRGVDHLPREDAEEAQEERLYGQVGEGPHQVLTLCSVRLLAVLWIRDPEPF